MIIEDIKAASKEIVPLPGHPGRFSLKPPVKAVWKKSGRNYLITQIDLNGQSPNCVKVKECNVWIHVDHFALPSTRQRLER